MTLRRIQVLAAMMASVGLCLSGCGHSILINSIPSGARVLIDNEPTDMLTPASIRLGSTKMGLHEISVEKDGYQTATPQHLRIQVDTPAVVLSCIFGGLLFPLIHNLAGDMWKRPLPRRLSTFELVPEEHAAK